MKTFIRSAAAGLFFLLLGMSMANAQEVTFTAGPTIPVASSGGTAGANGGFAWADLNGDGNLDLFVPSNIILFNNNTTFAAAASTATANIPPNNNDIGGLLADFNGDGVPDLFTTNGGTPAGGLFYNTAGVFTAATGTGDLATAGVTGENFQGAAAAPIDHSNYLSICWPGTFTGIAGNGAVPGGGAMWLLKGGSSGFTNIARGATAANLGIDTSRSFESWDVRFFDANNDGYQDLLMPSFRCGFSRIDTGSSGARKGSVMFLNDGTGKFIVPTAASLSRPIYRIDSLVLSKVSVSDSIIYASANPDTGIIVDDTVRHFSAIGEQFGDLNNDGIEDLILNGLGANDNRDGNGKYVADVILYGKGDGTFTYKWDGVHVVANNGITQATNQRAISIGDYNNDGLQDIYTSGTYGSQSLYRNNGDGTFTSVAGSGNGLTAGGQRAGQFVDYNNDGFLDIFMYTGGSATLQKNNGNTNKWVGFIPIGAGNNKSAVGARFVVYTGATKQMREISASAGSAGMGGTLRANFGLGTATKIDSVQVWWPDGTKQTYITGAANNTIVLNKYYTIQEGAVIPPAPTTARPSWAAHDTSLASTDTLKWNRVSSGTGATTYQYQIASNLSFGSIVKSGTLSDSSAIVRLGLSTKYYWRVQAFGNGVPGPMSAIDSFRTLIVADTVVPKQLLPASNSTTVPFKPTLVVSYVPTASTYHFQLSDTASMTRFIVNDSTSDFDTTWAVTQSLTPSKKYFWRIRGYNPAGSSNFSPVDSFTIMYLPATPTLVVPSNNQANVPVNPLTLKWRHEAGDSNYVVQLWTYTTGGQVLMVDTTKHDTSWTIASGLFNRFTYYWKVQCYNQGGASAYSAIDSFTSVIEVPQPPVPVSPKGIAVNQPRKTTFAWNPSTYALSYHLQISTSGAFSSFVVDTTIADTTMQIADTLAPSTQFYYRISAINLGGEGAFSSRTTFMTGTGVTGVSQFGNTVPKEFALFQNYPNPFNPTTMIRYDLPKNAFVQVIIYDVLGRQVAKLVDGMQQASQQSVVWNPGNMSSGVYFCRITARSVDGSGNFSAVKKLMFMK
jgi:hypothetical protein